MRAVRAVVAAALALCALGAAHAAEARKGPAAGFGGFRVGVQTYTFRGGTFETALDGAAAVGVEYVEAYSGQPFSRRFEDVTVGPAMTPAARQAMRAMLAARKLTLWSFGVIDLPADEAASRKVFDFAREMGVRVIVSEPAEEALPVVERLVREYGIKVAIHNHPEPSRYADPARVAQALGGCGPGIGASPDTGHWMRSGHRPLESLRLLKGRILGMHLKDLKAFGKRGERDWPFGEGILDIPAVFRELKAQGFDGAVMIEYEASQPDPTADVAACVQYLRRILSRPL